MIVIRSFLDQVFLPGRLVGLVMRDRPHAPPLPRIGYMKGELRKLAGVACGLFLDIHRSRCRGGVTLDPHSPPANKLADADLGSHNLAPCRATVNYMTIAVACTVTLTIASVGCGLAWFSLAWHEFRVSLSRGAWQRCTSKSQLHTPLPSPASINAA